MRASAGVILIKKMAGERQLPSRRILFSFISMRINNYPPLIPLTIQRGRIGPPPRRQGKLPASGKNIRRQLQLPSSTKACGVNNNITTRGVSSNIYLYLI